MPRIKICAKTIPKSQVFEMAFSTSIIHIFYYRIHVVRVSYKGQTKQCEGRLGLVLGSVFPLESKKRTYTYILTKNSGRILVANGHYTDKFGRFGHILRT